MTEPKRRAGRAGLEWGNSRRKGEITGLTFGGRCPHLHSKIQVPRP